jgi:hypothetical protein
MRGLLRAFLVGEPWISDGLETGSRCVHRHEARCEGQVQIEGGGQTGNGCWRPACADFFRVF